MADKINSETLKTVVTENVDVFSTDKNGLVPKAKASSGSTKYYLSNKGTWDEITAASNALSNYVNDGLLGTAISESAGYLTFKVHNSNFSPNRESIITMSDESLSLKASSRLTLKAGKDWDDNKIYSSVALSEGDLSIKSTSRIYLDSDEIVFSSYRTHNGRGRRFGHATWLSASVATYNRLVSYIDELYGDIGLDLDNSKHIEVPIRGLYQIYTGVWRPIIGVSFSQASEGYSIIYDNVGTPASVYNPKNYMILFD